MRQNGEKTDEKRMALLQEYLSSGMSRTAFEKEKGLGHCTISRWFRIFAVEDKPIVCSQQAAGRITGSVLLILRQISAEYLETKEAPPVGGASFMLVRHFNCLTGKVK